MTHTPSGICVFCGSVAGGRPSYADAARQLGTAIATRGLTLVCGGGNTGLMRVVADAALGKGGRVVGVIPDRLRSREGAHGGLTELRVVDSMHERKAVMATMADAFVALPGGLGTLDEVCEVLMFAQLGRYRKPSGLLNVDGYYDGLIAQFERARRDGFLSSRATAPLVEREPERLLGGLLAACPEVAR